MVQGQNFSARVEVVKFVWVGVCAETMGVVRVCATTYDVGVWWLPRKSDVLKYFVFLV